MKNIFAIFIVISAIFSIYSEEWKISKSGDYVRISDIIIKDLDGDGIDEIAISYYNYSEKNVDIYKTNNGELKLIDKISAPPRAIYFDVGDLNNDKKANVVFLASDGLYFKTIGENKKLTHIPSIFSEIVVAQPQLLKSVNLIMDLDNDKKNELVIQNIRAIEIYETTNFSKLASISLETFLEFSMVPGQFYPQYIFYTFPMTFITDIDGDGKKEIITKFPTAINIYGQQSLNKWYRKSVIKIAKDNIYFLINSFVKFTFPVISDINNDKKKEIIVSSAHLDIPRLRFEALGDIYFERKGNYVNDTTKQIVVKGVPLNLPVFLNISSKEYKDFVMPVIPFNIFTIFSILSGSGSIDVPFLYYQQTSSGFDTKKSRKLFDIPFKMENIVAFIEELPLDHYKDGEFPYFYYFSNNKKERTIDIIQYSYDIKKNGYKDEVIIKLDYVANQGETSVLKLGNFSKTKEKEIAYITSHNIFLITRK